MKKIIVINNVNQRQFGAQFQDDIEMQSWIDEQVSTNSWGLPDRWLQETDGTHTDTREVLIQEAQDERVVMQMQYDEEGNEIGEIEVTIPASEAVYQTEYFFPCDYTIEIEDKTAEYAEKARLQTIKDLAKKNKEDIEFGQLIIAVVGSKNEQKNLTHEQKNNMMADNYISSVMLMLQAGRIGYSKQLIESYPANESYFTAQDKQDILDLINEYLAG